MCSDLNTRLKPLEYTRPVPRRANMSTVHDIYFARAGPAQCTSNRLSAGHQASDGSETDCADPVRGDGLWRHRPAGDPPIAAAAELEVEGELLHGGIVDATP